jgi:two-component system, sensor histidine kinase LadS
MRIILLIALACCFGLASPAGWAGSDVRWERYFDKTGTLELPQAQLMAFAPASPYMQWNAAPGTLWLRFTLLDDGGEPFFLRWFRVTTDDVTVYLPGAATSSQGGVWRERKLSARELQVGYRLTGLSQNPYPIPRTFYVRLQSHGMHWIEPEVLTESESSKADEYDWFTLSAELALSLLALTGAVMQWIMRRRLAYAALAVLSAAMMGWNLNTEGLFVRLLELEPHSFVTITTFCSVVALLASPFFGTAILSAPVNLNPSGHALRWYLGVGLVILALTPFVWRVWIIPSALLLVHALGAHLVYRRYQTKGNAPFWPWKLLEEKLLALFFIAFSAVVMATIVGSLWVSGSTHQRLYHFVFNEAIFCLFGLGIMSRQDYVRHLHNKAQATAANVRERVDAQWRATQQQFLAMLVHEIRTPLTVIQFGNHAIARRALDPAQKAIWVQRMDGAVAAIRQILENCVHADRMDAGQQTAEIEEFAIEPVLQNAVERLQEHDGQGVERLQLCYEAETLRDVRCQADPAYVATILANLLGNALKYSPAGSPVRLRLHTQQQHGQQWLALWVHNEVDAGGGPNSARLFDRYYRAQSSGRVAGTGLGLWLCQVLAQQMQTQIAFEQSGLHIRFGFVLVQAP